jgi:MoaA/NifB/PqqE/SkfB family radical SAM enzyme
MLRRTLFFCNYWTTYKCNSKCEFCKIWKDDKLKNTLDASYKNARKNLDDLKKIGVKTIDFTGGEPLLNKELFDLLSYAKKRDFFIKLSTNGLLYPQKADELKGLPNRIYISFDTTDPDEYERIRGIDGFSKVLESIEIAKRMNQELCLLYTVTNENIKNISSIVEFCKKNKVTLYIHPCFQYFGNEELNKKNIKQIKKYFWEPYVRMSLPQLAFHNRGGNNNKKPTCLSGISTIDIGPDDCLTIPCFHKCIERIKINGELFDIYNSEKWKKYFENVGGYDFCNHCTIDCYFGLSYRDRILKYFIKQNLTYLKTFLELRRNRKNS